MLHKCNEHVKIQFAIHPALLLVSSSDRYLSLEGQVYVCIPEIVIVLNYRFAVSDKFTV